MIIISAFTKSGRFTSPVTVFSRMSSSNGSCSRVRIGTHSGTFHCDETLACSMLKMLPRYREAEIIRSRDQTLLDTCDVVVDVGGEYDPARLRFDHHQKTFSSSMNTLDKSKKWTIKLSSAGLVYFHYGREIIAAILETGVDDKITEKVFDKVYEGFIQEIDAIDNGIHTHDGDPRYTISTNLSSRVGNLGPCWNDPHQDTDAGFYKALELTRSEFLDKVNYYGRVWWSARDIVHQSLENRFSVHTSGRIMEFSQGGVPWKEHLFELEAEEGLTGDTNILYALFTDQSGMWRIQCVPVQPRSFTNRLSLPESWRGLRDGDLETVSGVPGATFVHAGGFIGGSKTREGVLAMAETALKQL